MRLRVPGTIDQAVERVRFLRGQLSTATGDSFGFGPEDAFLTWIDDYARPQFESLLAPDEELLVELDASHNRINMAPKSNVRRLNAMLSRERNDWERRLTEAMEELAWQKRLAERPGQQVVLDTSVMMEAGPLPSIDWHGMDPALAQGEIRLILPILAVEELDNLLHDRNGDRRKKARDATRTLVGLHGTRPTEPAALPGKPEVTIEVLLDGDWHQRRPNNDAEIVDQALAVHELTGKRVLLATCDLRMMYRAGVAGLPSTQVPRVGVL
ncbi:MAG: PIN domain-containing protein [Streptosporangiaceae bacterium]